jgi:transposase
MTLREIARAFVYYQTHTQRETAAMFGVSQATVGTAFRRVFGPEAVRDAEATWRVKRGSPRFPKR